MSHFRIVLAAGLGLVSTLAAGHGALPAPPGLPVRSERLDLSDTLWDRAARRRALDPYLLYAVALVESARIDDGRASPWPWALNHSGRTYYPDTAEAALAHLRSRVRSGHRVVDVGLMQVNLRWHGHRARSLEALLDPATNVEVGADILAEALASVPGDRTLGVGRYHAWQDKTAAYRYGRKVLALAARLRGD